MITRKFMDACESDREYGTALVQHSVVRLERHAA